MSMLFLSAQEVRDLLPLGECIDLMERAMRAVSNGSARIPGRIIAAVGSPVRGDIPQNHLFTMPGALEDPAVYGAKLVSSHPQNPQSGLPAFQGFVALFDPETGAPSALVDGAAITALRTAAASALASRELSRNDAISHGILGSGVQAREHALALLHVREINRVCIWGRDRSRAEALVDGLDLPATIDVRVCERVEEAAKCDIVSTTTGAKRPVLRGRQLKPGAHVNLVGSHAPDAREADSELMALAAIYCDRMESLMAEAGDVLIPLQEGRIAEKAIVGEIGQLLEGRIEGRTDARQVTVYKSLGVIAQDLIAAETVRCKAVEKGLGTRL